MKFEIKSRWDGSILFSVEAGSLKLAVEAAVKSGANLSGADLYGHAVSGLVLSGWARNYDWIIAETVDGLFLKFGCESRLWSEWESAGVRTICERHEPEGEYERTIRGIVDFHAACKQPEVA